MMIDVKSLRKKTGLSQSDFCKCYDIPVATLRDWEQGRRKCPEYVIKLLDFKVEYDIKHNF